MYVDYDYYANDFYGTLIPVSDFKKKAFEASNKVKHYTLGRSEDNQDLSSVKNATCSIAELLYEQEQIKSSINNQTVNNKQIASETVGPRSITYADKSSEISKQLLSDSELDKKIRKICYEYVSDLMYRGVYVSS